jgi:hypothetical protein
MAEEKEEKKSRAVIYIVIVVITIIIIFALAGSSNQSNNNQTRTTNEQLSLPAQSQSTPTNQVNYDEMVKSCQDVADTQLREGMFESSYVEYPSGYTQPSIVRDIVRYDSSKSICYFLTFVVNYPNAYSVSDPYMTAGGYLYAAVLLSDGRVAKPKNNNAVQMVAYSNIRSFTYPKPMDEAKYFNFDLKLNDMGTDNYSVQTLSIGQDISKAEFDAIVNNDLGMSNDEVIRQLKIQ